MITLTALPVDILILILETLGVHDFTALSLTCHSMYSIVTQYGWSNYLRSNPRPSWSLSMARDLWPPRTRARYDFKADSAWSECNFTARPLSKIWKGKLQPILAVTPSRLVIGAGSNIYSYAFGTSRNSSASPPVSFEGVASLIDSPQRLRNITALTFFEDGGLHRTLDVAFQDGAIERVYIESTIPNNGGTDLPSQLSITRTKVTPVPNGDFVESLSSQSNLTLALSSTGHARLTTTSSIDSVSTSIELKSRSWVSHLCLNSSTPYAAFGTASTTPLAIHALMDGGHLSTHPMAILHTPKASADVPVEKMPSSAVYGIARGPLASPWGASPQVIVSGWFDGQVRCYDLRSSSRFSSSSSNTPSIGTTALNTNSSQSPKLTAPLLRPVLSLADRWSYEPIYSVASGGGSAAHIAAGTARHSVVSFWDVRSPSNGWSVHAPGNDPSPVYSVVLESSRFFGVTQSRPFVYDFGPGVSLNTYPPMPQIRNFDNLKQKKGSNRATYHVLRYGHNSTGLCNEL